MIQESLIKKIFSASSLQRWNDHVKPIELTEIDKQSHKMIIAYTIAKIEEENGEKIDWVRLIEGAFFELIHRIVLTDLRPNVYYRIMEEKKDEINKWVIGELDRHIKNIKNNFKEKFKNYLFDNEYSLKEKKILKVAHFMATEYEFEMIYRFNRFMYGVDKTKKEIEEKKEKYMELSGTKEIMERGEIYNFINLCGQLRLQQRWAQSPRIPKTSVLGHMYFVALLSYLCSIEINACPKRIYNNFFVSLFHDLPEVLTRDIVSPIKMSVEGLDEIIKTYEKKQMEEIIYPLVPDFIKKDLEYFTEEEFENKVIIDGEIKKGITNEEIQKYYNEGKYMPVDGKILKVCDHLAAFIEAKMSISHGIKSEQLEEGVINLYKKYKDKEILGIDFGRIFDYF